jgi:hypothetical protein
MLLLSTQKDSRTNLAGCRDKTVTARDSVEATHSGG